MVGRSAKLNTLMSGVNDSGNGGSDPILYRVAVNDEIRHKVYLHPKPDTAEAKRARVSLTYRYEVVELSGEELTQCFRERKNITSVCIDDKGNFHREKESFVSADIVILDVDNDKTVDEIVDIGGKKRKKKKKVKCEGDEYLTYEAALKHPLVEECGLFAYTTAGHKESHHKFRLGFALPQRIEIDLTAEDRKKARADAVARFEAIADALIWEFKSDKACSDVSRFFFGAGENGLVTYIGRRLTDEKVKELQDRYAESQKQESEAVNREVIKESAHHIFIFDAETEAERRKMYGQRLLNTAQRRIYDSVPPAGDLHGNRHDTRLAMARLVGGGVAGGLLSYGEARAALEDYVRANTNDFAYAMKDIDDGLRNGMASPITLEHLEAEYQHYLSSKHQSRQTQAKRAPITEDERKERAEFWRKSSDSPEALAADVLGSKSARHLLQLWTEVQFTDEAKVLLIAWEALAQGCEQVDYHYGDLYEILYKCDGSEFEQTAKGRMLKSSCRQKLADRIARFEAEQERIKITFAYPIPGHLDLNDNPLPSRVTLYSRQIVAEALVMAEEMPGFARARKETRSKAIRQIVEEKTGVAHIKKPPKKYDRHKKIADSWKRMKGDQDSAIRQMEARGDSLRHICETAMEFYDRRVVTYIKKKGRDEAAWTDLPCNTTEVSQPEQSTSRPGSQPVGDFDLTYKTAASAENATDDHAQNFSFVQTERAKPLPDAVKNDLWAKFYASPKAKFATLEWLRTHALDAFDKSLYEKPEDHPDYGAEYEKHYARFYAEAIADCPQDRKASDLLPRVKLESEADAIKCDLGHGVTMTKQADGSTLISGNGDAESKQQNRIRNWREGIARQYAAMNAGLPPEKLPNVEPEDIPSEVFEEYQNLLAVLRDYKPTKDDWGKPLPVVGDVDMDDFDYGRPN